MSETLTQVKTPLWKPGTKSNNIEFLSSFKRLEKEDFRTYQIIDQKEGYVCQDHNYEYRVGKSQYGLWASRRRLELSQSQTVTPSKTVENGNLPVRLTNDEKIIALENRLANLEKEFSKLKEWIAVYPLR